LSTGEWRVKPSEIKRTVKSVQSLGLHIRNIEVSPDGMIRVNVAEQAQPLEREKHDPGEWD
jgi:hypothetical protein